MKQLLFALVLLVTLAFAQINASAALPDLVVNQDRLRKSVKVVKRHFQRGNCEAAEECITAFGVRKLLLFDVGIANLGKGDLVIGNPVARLDLFHHSPCHGHYHMTGFAVYKLLRPNYQTVTRSRKQGFCFRDDKPYRASKKPSRGYSCDYQGISSGWQDLYDQKVECQFIDVTGVRPGKYLLLVKLNPKHWVKESNYLNNQVIIPITIPRLR
jgi:hypothetical protein